MGTTLWELYYGSYNKGVILWELCYGSYSVGVILWELYVWELYYGSLINYTKLYYKSYIIKVIL
jgi:hypothetical protein